MPDFRRFAAHTGGRTTWVNIDAITHVDADERGVVSLHFAGGGSVTVEGAIATIMTDLLPPNRYGPRAP